jgi:hypothetical protein
MKEFSDFRDNWLTQEKLDQIKNQAIEQTKEIKNASERSFMATFSATYSLLLLAEYHEWINRQKSQR